VNWVFYKGPIFSDEEPGHPKVEYVEWWQKPSPNGTFQLDLVKDQDVEDEVVLKVMEPTTIDSFWESWLSNAKNEPFTFRTYLFASERDKEIFFDCPVYEFGIATFYWEIPRQVHRKDSYRMRLTASDSWGGENTSLVSLSKPYRAGEQRGWGGALPVMGVVFGIVLLVLGGVCGALWVARWRRRVRYRTIIGSDEDWAEAASLSENGDDEELDGPGVRAVPL